MILQLKNLTAEPGAPPPSATPGLAAAVIVLTHEWFHSLNFIDDRGAPLSATLALATGCCCAIAAVTATVIECVGSMCHGESFSGAMPAVLLLVTHHDLLGQMVFFCWPQRIRHVTQKCRWYAFDYDDISALSLDVLVCEHANRCCILGRTPTSFPKVPVHTTYVHSSAACTLPIATTAVRATCYCTATLHSRVIVLQQQYEVPSKCIATVAVPPSSL